jgi:hypothetical protein
MSYYEEKCWQCGEAREKAYLEGREYTEKCGECDGKGVVWVFDVEGDGRHEMV